jgi:Kef-type K+ transport system membrane component KefB/mannitol/fructose-specific phosphotransferase system IIA component (Ntr-type)
VRAAEASVSVPGGGVHGASPHDVVVFLLGLAVILVAARALGELALRFGQPAVLGEILAGVLLGPTALGALSPELQLGLFPEDGASRMLLDGVRLLAVTLFLLVAGLEIDLDRVLRQGRAATFVSLSGMLVPFAVGAGLAWFAPALIGGSGAADPLVHALFLGAALSISALPVIAKTLLDLRLYRSDIGMVVMASAIVDDLVGWIVFAVILAMAGGDNPHNLSIGATIGATLAFVAFMLTAFRWLAHRALPAIQAYTSWPNGVLSLTIALALACGALTEWIGVHAIFGAFMAGVALGDSRHLRATTRRTIDHFVSAALAPIFFGSIGLYVDFAAAFDLGLVLVVVVIATAGKLLGCGLGALWAGMPRRHSAAIGFAMNARGAMEIIFALLARSLGIIDEPLFVALVVMALVTSAVSGPAMMRVLRQRRPRQLADFLAPTAFSPSLTALDRAGAIAELSALVADSAQLPAADIAAAVWAREQMMPTGIGESVAVPHAALATLDRPAVAVGFHRAGVDFEAPDGTPCHVLCLLLTPSAEPNTQLELIAAVAHSFGGGRATTLLDDVSNYTELRAHLRAAAPDEEAA